MEIVLHPNKAGTYKKNLVEPGRNQPCYCGSEKKYKHCHLEKNYAQVREQVIAAGKNNIKAKETPSAEPIVKAPAPAPGPAVKAYAASGAFAFIKRGLSLHRNKKP